MHYIVPAQALVRRFVAEVAALDPPPGLVIATGDLVNDSNQITDDEIIRRVFADYQAALTRLPAPLLSLVGNHDLPGYGGKLPPDDPLFGVRGFEALIGPAWYSLDYAGCHLVMLLASTRDADTGQAGEGVPEECLRWLEKDLAVTPKDRPLLLFSHQPPDLLAEDRRAAGGRPRAWACSAATSTATRSTRWGDWTVYEDGALFRRLVDGPGPRGHAPGVPGGDGRGGGRLRARSTSRRRAVPRRLDFRPLAR